MALRFLLIVCLFFAPLGTAAQTQTPHVVVIMHFPKGAVVNLATLACKTEEEAVTLFNMIAHNEEQAVALYVGGFTTSCKRAVLAKVVTTETLIRPGTNGVGIIIVSPQTNDTEHYYIVDNFVVDEPPKEKDY